MKTHILMERNKRVNKNYKIICKWYKDDKNKAI